MEYGRKDKAKRASGNSMWELLRARNFRLLWGAGTLSAIGDQFDLIAFPWLVLLLTGDALAIGTVIAVGSVPTVLFMLIGGSVVDRSSPRMILQLSNIARILIGSVLAALVLAGWLNLWLLYLFALAKGIADAFYYPAQSALLPRIVTDKQLRHANVITQTTTEASGFVGPMLAGALIAAFSGTNSVVPALEGITAGARADTAGVGLAFAVVSAAFLISFLLLAFMRLKPEGPEAAGHSAESQTAGKEGGESVWASIADGFRFVRSDAAMFTLFVLIAGIELFVQGPVIVGIPVLADTQLPQGHWPSALSSLLMPAAHCLAAVSGRIACSPKGSGPHSCRHLCPERYSDHALWLSDSDVAGRRSGCCHWRHGRIHEHHVYGLATGADAQRVMGRVMSLLIIASIGLSPISSAVSGGLIKLSLGWVFVGAGAMMALLSIAAGMRREIGEMKMA